MEHRAGISRVMSGRADRGRDLMKEQGLMLNRVLSWAQQRVGEEEKDWDGKREGEGGPGGPEALEARKVLEWVFK